MVSVVLLVPSVLEVPVVPLVSVAAHRSMVLFSNVAISGMPCWLGRPQDEPAQAVSGSMNHLSYYQCRRQCQPCRCQLQGHVLAKGAQCVCQPCLIHVRQTYRPDDHLAAKVNMHMPHGSARPAQAGSAGRQLRLTSHHPVIHARVHVHAMAVVGVIVAVVRCGPCKKERAAVQTHKQTAAFQLNSTVLLTGWTKLAESRAHSQTQAATTPAQHHPDAAQASPGVSLVDHFTVDGHKQDVNIADLSCECGWEESRGSSERRCKQAGSMWPHIAARCLACRRRQG